LKRLIIPGAILAAVLALFQWGNRLLESTLDAQLPGLLTRELGIQVTIDPVKTRIPNLTVHTDKLVMGDPTNPALVATGVNISLAWSDLLHGEIRLRRGSGSTLMVNPSLWPGNDDPWPTDYSSIEPYLPDQLSLDSARYVNATGDTYIFTQPRWQRESPAAHLQWQDEWNGQTVAISVVLKSLQNLLQLTRLQLEVTASAPDKNSGAISATLDLQPGSSSGYDLTLTATAAEMTATLKSGNSTAWTLPEKSTTSIDAIEAGKLIALIGEFRGDNKADTESWLQTTLPRLDLPEHKGQIAITKISWNDEVTLHNNIDFVTGPNGISIPSITSTGPGGVLKASASIASSAGGWTVSADANITATRNGQGLAAAYVESDWLWQEGKSTIKGQGETWDALLSSLTGDIALAFNHRNTVNTPVSITATLDNRPGELALENLEIKVAQGHISGWAKLAGQEQKRLSGMLKAVKVNADFLIPDADPNAPPGLPVPEFLDALPGVDLDLQLDVNELAAGGVFISNAEIAIARTPEKGKVTVHAAGATGGIIDLELDAAIFPVKPALVTLGAKIANFNLARLFQQSEAFIDARTSGTVNFSSQGKDLNEVFRAMKGTARLDIEFRKDHDWKRQGTPQEELKLSGDASLVMTQTRITGLQITSLVADNILQNLTGTVSIVDGRKPWLEADLTSSHLDIPSLRDFQSQQNADDKDSDPMQVLRELGDARMSLKVESLKLASATLTGAVAQVSTAPDSITIDQLDFSLEGGQLTSKGAINWQKDEAAFALDARVKELDIEKFLTDLPGTESLPLSGNITLSSKGNTLDRMLASLSGDINLTTTVSTGSAAISASDSVAKIEMSADRTADGMRAEIHRFQWAGTDLSGSVQYHQSTPPLVDIEIGGGALSILPFEEHDTQPAKDEDKDKKSGASIIGSTAEAGASMLGDAITAPLRMFFGPREANPGDKLFSSTPMSFAWMNNNRLNLSGKIDTITSTSTSASDVRFSGKLANGVFALEASAGAVNKGSASINISLSASELPATLAMSGTFTDLRGQLIKADIPRSGSFNLTTRGQSEAELAANANGLLYLEIGAGPIDYNNLSLLTADVATNAFETLIPGVKKTQPKLDCAVTLAVFNDGIGTTPFGFAARTQDANLIGKVDVNLKKELMHISFSSSNRKGIGLSVGSVFSNTVEIEGPLTDPRIVPNTTGLLWRGWAAVMTGGLSVLGESMVKRALASDNPCGSVQHHIHKEFCGTPEAAGASTMVCPTT
jgi:AsmA family